MNAINRALPPDHAGELITTADTAALLGVTVSAAYKLIARGRLAPAVVRDGRRVQLRRELVEAEVGRRQAFAERRRSALRLLRTHPELTDAEIARRTRYVAASVWGLRRRELGQEVAR